MSRNAFYKLDREYNEHQELMEEIKHTILDPWYQSPRHEIDLDRAIRAYASCLLGREFGESVDSYLARSVRARQLKDTMETLKKAKERNNL